MTPDEQILKDIGARVKKIREAKRTKDGKKWTHAQLAAAMDTSTSQISLIENGKREPGILMLYKLARVLECDMADLLPE